MSSVPTLAPGGTGAGAPEPRSTDLERLQRVTAAFAARRPPEEVLRQVVDTVRELVRGAGAALALSPEQAAIFVSEAELHCGEVALDERSSLVWRGQRADEVRDWEGASDVVVVDSGARLIVPMPAGGIAVEQPGVNVLLDADLRPLLQVLSDFAAGMLAVAARLRDANERSVALERTRQRLHEQNVLLQELAVVDQLTGLYNRRFFDRRLAYELERFHRYGHPLSLMIFDVDRFKQVNDTHGHSAGDQVLQHLGAVAQQAVRKVDILCRYGGEEFAWLMPDTTARGAAAAAERLRARVESSPALVGGRSIETTISCGVAGTFEGFEGDAAWLVRSADQALYRAKAGGRNRVEVSAGAV